MNPLQGSLNSPVEHRHRISEFSCVFKSLQHGAKALEGVVIVEECLSKWFFGKPGTQALCFLDIGKCFLVSGG